MCELRYKGEGRGYLGSIKENMAKVIFAGTVFFSSIINLVSMCFELSQAHRAQGYRSRLSISDIK